MMLTTHNAVRKINGVGRLLVVLLEGCDLQASDVNGKTISKSGILDAVTKLQCCTSTFCSFLILTIAMHIISTMPVNLLVY